MFGTRFPTRSPSTRILYRFESAVKTSAFPTRRTRQGLSEEDIKNLAYPDSNIEVSDPMGQGITNVIAYLQPASISPLCQGHLAGDHRSHQRACRGR